MSRDFKAGGEKIFKYKAIGEAEQGTPIYYKILNIFIDF